MTTPPFDLAQAHRYFAAHCFNLTWELIDKPDRTPADDEMMLHGSIASLWHWKHCEHCTDTNLSVGYWQLARIETLLRHTASALAHAEICLRHSEHLPPFYLGYAHEALARATLLAGDESRARHHLHLAQLCLPQIIELEQRQALAADLETIR